MLFLLFSHFSNFFLIHSYSGFIHFVISLYIPRRLSISLKEYQVIAVCRCPRERFFPLIPELFSLTLYFRPSTNYFLNLKRLSSPNPAEVLFCFNASVETSFLQGAILSVPHLLTPSGINDHIS